MKRSSLTIRLVVLLTLTSTCLDAIAQTGGDVNSVASGNWVSGTTWDSGSSPAGDQDANVIGGLTVTLNSGDTADAFRIALGETTDSSTSTINMTGGTLNTDRVLAVGGATNADMAWNGLGIFNQSGGDVNIGAIQAGQGFEGLTVGGRSGQVGTYNISGGTLLAPEAIYLGSFALADGTINQTAGAVTGGSLSIGLEGSGLYAMSGGTLTIIDNLTSTNVDANGDVFVSNFSNSTGTLALSADSMVDLAGNLNIAAATDEDGNATTGASGTLELIGSDVSLFVSGDLFADGHDADSTNNSSLSYTTDQDGVSTIDVSGMADIGGAVFDIVETGPVSIGTTFDLVSTFSGINNFGSAQLGPNSSNYALQLANNNSVLQAVKVSDGVSGDFDNDGDVDGVDFLAWQRGESPSSLSPADLADWQSNYGTASVGGIVAVPEPSTIAFIPFCIGLLIFARHQAWLSRS